MLKSAGINQDFNELQQPPNTYRSAKNLVASKELGALVSELGTTALSTIQGTIIGFTPTPSSGTVLFTKNGTTGWVYLFKDNSLELIKEDQFNFGEYIHATADTSSIGDVLVYFTDGKNPPRFINVSNPQNSLSNMVVFPTIQSVGLFKDVKINNSGGILETGTYYFAIRYRELDGTVTNFINISQPLPIALFNPNNKRFSSGPSGIRTSKSISFKIDNIDQNYDLLEIAVIKYVGDVLSDTVLLPAKPINNQSVNFTYTGNETTTLLALEEIVINNNTDPETGKRYGHVGTLAVQDGQLYLGDLCTCQTFEDIGFQSFANNIKVKLEFSSPNVLNNTPTSGNPLSFTNNNFPFENERGYKKELLEQGKQTFRAGDVYALYIAFILRDGSLSKAYHIPGRAKRQFELFADYDYLNNPLLDPDTNLCYWENENETYPDDFGLGSNTKVRHHRIPTYDQFPLAWTTRAFTIRGFKLENVQIPQEIKDKVLGYKVFYAKRTPDNSLMVDQSLMINARINDGLYRAQDSHGTLSLDFTGGEASPNTFYTHPHSLMNTKDNVSSIALARLYRVYSNGNVRDSYSASDSNSQRFRAFSHHLKNTLPESASAFEGVRNADNSIFYPNLAQNPFVSKVNAAAFVESSDISTSTTITDKGFTTDIDNNRGEGKLIIELEKNLLASRMNDLRDTYFIADFYRDVKSLYDSFDQQELVYTGYIQTNLEATTSDIIYGGDTYIGWYGSRANRRTDSNVRVDSSLHMYFYEGFDNIHFREAGELPWQSFYPFTPTIEVVGRSIPQSLFIFFDESNKASIAQKDRREYDQFFKYSLGNKVNNIKPPSPKEKFDTEVTFFPTRIIRGSRDQRNNGFRVFKPQDYYDLPKSRGKLTALRIWNNTLLPHMKRGLFYTRGREELQIDDIRAFIGTGDIFSTAPNELLSTPEGFAGLQHVYHGNITEVGYIFADVEAGKVFKIQEGIKEVSQNGLRTFFRKNLENPMITYDEINKRFIVIDNNYALSYSLDFDSWTSFHSYKGQLKPTFVFNNLRNWFSQFGTQLFEHNTGMPYSYYGTTVSPEYEFVNNESPEIEKILQSLEFNILVKDSNGTIVDVPFIPISHIEIQNTIQTTGWVDTSYFLDGGNARKTTNMWRVNAFRDNSSSEWYEQRKLRDKWHKTTLIFNKTDNNSLYLLSADIIQKPITR